MFDLKKFNCQGGIYLKKISSVILSSMLLFTFLPYQNTSALNVKYPAKTTSKSLKFTSKSITQTVKTYVLDLKKWGIYNNGTHAIETTKGINAALKWSHDNGYQKIIIPSGTYLIAKGSKGGDSEARINMVGDMFFDASNNVVFKKETNSFEGYQLMYIGSEANNVTIKGGTYIGDRDSHDYYDGAVTWTPNTVYKLGDLVKPTFAKSKDWGFYYKVIKAGTSGSNEPSWFWTKQSNDNDVIFQPVERSTHEGGYGIVTGGAYNVTIDGVNTHHFTGDGMAVGGENLYFKDLYSSSFESGSIDQYGNKVDSQSSIRLKDNQSLMDKSFAKTHTMIIDNPKGLNWHFNIHFYGNGKFISSKENINKGDIISIPTGADSFNLVYNQATFNNAYVEIWNKLQSKKVLIKNSESAFNRRQGITVGGGDNITIEKNKIHDIGGTAPMSAIDVEGGYGDGGMVNSNIFIRNNDFYRNARYDVILFDGHDALVEGNRMNSNIGLAVSEPFTNAIIKNNAFNKSNIYAYHDVHFIGNVMNGQAYTHLEGPNLTINGMVFKNHAEFVTSSSKPYGITIENVTLYDSNFSTWVEPIRVNNMTIYRGSMGGGAKDGSTFDNLKVIDHKGTNFPSGTYKNCLFQAEKNNHSSGPHSLISGKFTFDTCKFIGTGLGIHNKDSEVTVKNSIFTILQNSNAIGITAAKKVDIENNTITANMQKENFWGEPMSVIELNGYWQKNEPADVSNVVIKNNIITSNARDSRGISSIYSGVGADSFVIENNTLYNTKLALKERDIDKNNRIFVKFNNKWLQELIGKFNFSSQDTSFRFSSVTSNGDVYVGVGENGLVATSFDGSTWSKVTSPKQDVDFYTITYHNGLFVAAGNKGTIMTSLDGKTWTLRDSKSVYGTFQNVKFLNNRFIAVGWGHAIATSPDGINWTKGNIAGSNPFNDVAWNGSVYVVSGPFNIIYTSKDGVNWKEGKASIQINSITSDGSKFVAVGSQGFIATSIDGVNWTNQVSSTLNNLNHIAWNGTHFMAVGDKGTVLTSSTGLYWKKEFVNLPYSLEHVNTFNRQFFILSDSDNLLKTNP